MYLYMCVCVCVCVCVWEKRKEGIKGNHRKLEKRNKK